MTCWVVVPEGRDEETLYQRSLSESAHKYLIGLFRSTVIGNLHVYKVMT